MKIQCLVFICIIALARPASVRHKQIPVKIVYENVRSNVANGRELETSQQLQDATDVKSPKAQIETQNKPTQAEVFSAGGPGVTQAITEKSQEDFTTAFDKDTTSEKILDRGLLSSLFFNSSRGNQNNNNNNNNNNADDDEDDGLFGGGDLFGEDEPEPENHVILDKAREVALQGLKLLKDKYIEYQKLEGNRYPTAIWTNLERDVENLFETEKNKLQGKQSNSVPNPVQSQNPGILQNVVNGFQNITSNFIQGFQQRPATGNNGSQPAGQRPGFISYFTGEVQQVVGNINGIGANNNAGGGNGTQANTLQAEPAASASVSNNNNPGFLQGGILNQFSQAVSNFIPGNRPQQQSLQAAQGNTPIPNSMNTQAESVQQPTPQNNQAATATNQQRPPGFFQGAINQFNQVVGNIIPTTRSPQIAPVTGSNHQTQSDTQTQRPPGLFQGAINQFGQAISNIIPVNRLTSPSATQQNPGLPLPSTQASTQADTTASSNEAVNSVNVVENSNPQVTENQQNQQTVSENNQAKPATSSPASTARPPGLFQGAVSQFNQAINNFIPGSRPTQATPVQPGSNAQAGVIQRPLEVVQNFGNRIVSTINRLHYPAGSTYVPIITTEQAKNEQGGNGQQHVQEAEQLPEISNNISDEQIKDKDDNIESKHNINFLI